MSMKLILLFIILLNLKNINPARISVVLENCQMKFSIRELSCDVHETIHLNAQEANNEENKRIYNSLHMTMKEDQQIIFRCHVLDKISKESLCEYNLETFVHRVDTFLTCDIVIDQFRPSNLLKKDPICTVMQLVPNKQIYTLNLKWTITNDNVVDHSSRYFNIVIFIITLTVLLIPRWKINRRQVANLVSVNLCYWAMVCLQQVSMSMWVTANELTRFGRNIYVSIILLLVWIIWNIITSPSCLLFREFVFTTISGILNSVINALICRNYYITSFLIPTMAEAGKSGGNEFRVEVAIEIVELLVQATLITILIVFQNV